MKDSFMLVDLALGWFPLNLPVVRADGQHPYSTVFYSNALAEASKNDVCETHVGPVSQFHRGTGTIVVLQCRDFEREVPGKKGTQCDTIRTPTHKVKQCPPVVLPLAAMTTTAAAVAILVVAVVSIVVVAIASCP